MGISDKLFRIAKLSPDDMKMELLRLAEEQAKEERRLMLQRNRTQECRARKRYGNGGKNVTVTGRYGNVDRYGNVIEKSSVTVTNGIDLTQETGVTVTIPKTEYIYSKRVIERKKVRKKDYTPDFETFWNLYPRKAAKPDAFKAFSRAMKEKVPLETIVTGLKKFTFSDEVQYVPLPATWLNKRRWEDQSPSDYKTPIPAKPPPIITPRTPLPVLDVKPAGALT